MQLVRPSLTSRSFLIQFLEIMKEFGGIIPWLAGMEELAFATRAVVFRDQLLRRLGCEEDGIVPYQFVSEDDPRTFIGGILHLPNSPERFGDRHNMRVMKSLIDEEHEYISCLQVRALHRGQSIGNHMMPRALRAILRVHPRVWAVASNPDLIPWYVRLGAQVHSKPDNTDHLWILSWQSTTQQVRSS